MSQNQVPEYLKKNKVIMLKWPDNSFHHKFVQNFWDYMKNKVEDELPALVNVIKDGWSTEISAECCQSFIASVFCRIETVMKGNDSHKNYQHILKLI